MNFPVVIVIGTNKFPVHFLFEILSYTLGFRTYLLLKRNYKDPIPETSRITLLIAAAIGAFFGSHILGVLEDPRVLNQINILYFMGNTTIVGGLLGGLFAVEFIKKRIGIVESTGDILVFPIIVSMIIGRIGCFLSGLTDGTYGIPSSLPWAINLGDRVTRHPTNLYEIGFWLILAAALRILEKSSFLKNGIQFKILMISYLVFRFWIEFIKPSYFFPIGLSTIQTACLAGLFYYAILGTLKSKLKFSSHSKIHA